MPLVAAAVAPHGFPLIPLVSDTADGALATRAAMQEMGRRFAAAPARRDRAERAARLPRAQAHHPRQCVARRRDAALGGSTGRDEPAARRRLHPGHRGPRAGKGRADRRSWLRQFRPARQHAADRLGLDDAALVRRPRHQHGRLRLCAGRLPQGPTGADWSASRAITPATELPREQNVELRTRRGRGRRGQRQARRLRRLVRLVAHALRQRPLWFAPRPPSRWTPRCWPQSPPTTRSA